MSLDVSEVKTFARGVGDLVWLGTARGLWRTNSSATALVGPWRVPSPLPGSGITALARDPAGRMWIGTHSGALTIAPDGSTESPLRERVLCLAADSRGDMWVGTPTGLYRLRPDRVPEMVLAETVSVLAIDRADTPWASTTQGRLLKLTDEGVEPVFDFSNVGALPRDMAIDYGGTIWLALEIGLGMLSPEREFSLATAEDGLLSEDVRAVAVGPDDAVWMATARGLARRLASGRWTRFTTESTEGGLRSMEMWDVHVERSGVVWMVTDAGISRRTPEQDWFFYDLKGVRSVLADPEAKVAWLGAPSGLYRMRRDALVKVE